MWTPKEWSGGWDLKEWSIVVNKGAVWLSNTKEEVWLSDYVKIKKPPYLLIFV